MYDNEIRISDLTEAELKKCIGKTIRFSKKLLYTRDSWEVEIEGMARKDGSYIDTDELSDEEIKKEVENYKNMLENWGMDVNSRSAYIPAGTKAKIISYSSLNGWNPEFELERNNEIIIFCLGAISGQHDEGDTMFIE